MANVGRLPADERRRQLELLGAASAVELRARLQPRLSGGCTAAACAARLERPSLDGRSHLALEIRADPRATRMQMGGRTVSFAARSGGAVRLTVRITTDAVPLTPLPRDSIFNPAFLAFLAEAGAADPASPRARRLEREVRSVELLSSAEKLMAGLPNFATYFGRDMLMTALMMRPVWRPAVSEHVIASVLRKLSPRGDVSHEEALGGQAIRENAAEYNLMARYFDRRGYSGRGTAARSVRCQRARQRARSRCPRAVLRRPPEDPRELSHAGRRVPAADPGGALPRGLRGSASAEARLPARRRSPARRRLALLLRELALVAAETRPYARDPRATNLVSFVKRDATHWRSASWRDSDAGYANGRFAMDINAIWAPRALEAIAAILATLPALGIRRPASTRSCLSSDGARSASTWPTRPRSGARSTPGTAPGVTSSSRSRREEIARRLGAKLASLPAPERPYWTDVDDRPGRRGRLARLPCAVAGFGRPPDPGRQHRSRDRAVSGRHARSPRRSGSTQLEPFLRPYPVGLFVDGLGPLVANDAYAPPRVWDASRRMPITAPASSGAAKSICCCSASPT